MTSYEVGSIASAISQIKPEVAKKKTDTKNQNVLEELFANASVHAVVANVPIIVPEENSKTKKGKGKKKARDNEQYSISTMPKIKKTDKVDELDDDEIQKVLDPGPEDEDDAEDTNATGHEGRRLKKIELKNIKKNKTLKDKQVSEDGNRVIMIKNLPIKVQSKQVHHMFAKFGKIDAVWLRCASVPDPSISKRVAIITKKFHPGRETISAFVRFERPESAQEALSMTGTEYKERHISVCLSLKSKKDVGKAVFVGNLPFDIEDEVLWQHFRECGTIMDVRIVRDTTTSMGKGFGYVNFSSSDAVELALRLDESTVKERKIRVSRCKNNPKPKVEKTPQKPKFVGAQRRLEMKQKGSEVKTPVGQAHSFSGERTTLGEKPDSKTAGAFRRIKAKQQIGVDKPAAKADKPKPRPETAKPKSFAGQTATSKAKPTKKGKVVKKNIEDRKKRIVAAKLGFKKSK